MSRMDLLPPHLAHGVYNEPWQTGAMANAPWEYRYQYMSSGWRTFSYTDGTGSWALSNYPLKFAQQSANLSPPTIPVFTYYYYGSIENPGSSSTYRTSTTSMNTYYTDFAAAMTSAAASGVSPIIFHMEPDTWGYIQQTFGDDPSVCAFSVASSGYTGLSGLPNDARGFAQALIIIRNAIAPNVILGFHVSMWGANWFPTVGTPTPYANHLITFYNNLNANFDMLFFETSDADAAYQVLHPERWSNTTTWWMNAQAYTDCISYISIVKASLGLQSMLWQMPVGNTLYKTCNNGIAASGAVNAGSSTTTLTFVATPAGVANGQLVGDVTGPSRIPVFTTVSSFTGTTVVLSSAASGVLNGDSILFWGPGHYQDNKVEYFLSNTASIHAGGSQTNNSFTNLTALVNAGCVAILWGMGQYNIDTDYIDRVGDGITNPAALANGNPFSTTTSLTSIYSDDDGGLLRVGTTAYYAAGPISTIALQSQACL